MAGVMRPIRIVRVPQLESRREGIRASINYFRSRAGALRAKGDFNAGLAYLKAASELESALLNN